MSFQVDNYETLNSNLFCLRLNELNDFHPMVFLAFQDIHNHLCKRCGLYLSSLSCPQEGATSWKCSGCDSVVTTNTPLKKIPYHDVEYQNYQSSHSMFDDQKAVRSYVFCIDISGSMQGAKMDLAKSASLKMIEELYKNHPESKVVVNMFNSDGATLDYQKLGNNKYTFHSKLTKMFANRSQFESNNFNRSLMVTQAEKVPTLRESYECVKSMIGSLYAQGGTSISEALTYSILLAAELKNCSIILCSDGEIDEKSQGARTQVFFDKIIDYANRNSTRIYTLRLDNCALQDFENLSRKTGGKLANLDQMNHRDFNWIIDDIKLDAEINKYNSVSIMSSRKDLTLKCLYQANIVNQDRASNRIDLEPFCLNSPKELYIEVNQTGHGNFDQKEPFFIQLQLKSSSYHRIISLPVELKSTDSGSKCCFAKKPPYDFKDAVHNREIVHLNAWRYLSFLLLEKKRISLAKRYLDMNRDHLTTMFLKDAGLKRYLQDLLTSLTNYSDQSRDDYIKIDDESTMFLSNILSDANQVAIDDVYLVEDYNYSMNLLVTWDDFKAQKDVYGAFQQFVPPAAASMFDAMGSQASFGANMMPPIFGAGGMFGQGGMFGAGAQPSFPPTPSNRPNSQADMGSGMMPNDFMNQFMPPIASGMFNAMAQMGAPVNPPMSNPFMSPGGMFPGFPFPGNGPNRPN